MKRLAGAFRAIVVGALLAGTASLPAAVVLAPRHGPAEPATPTTTSVAPDGYARVADGKVPYFEDCKAAEEWAILHKTNALC